MNMTTATAAASKRIAVPARSLTRTALVRAGRLRGGLQRCRGLETHGDRPNRQ